MAAVDRECRANHAASVFVRFQERGWERVSRSLAVETAARPGPWRVRFTTARPSAPQDQRTASTYIFGPVCPRDGKGAALVLPFYNTAGMSLHLVEPGRHAVLLLDQAGWHLSADLEVPANITVLPLPAKCPELNVMENVWQFMRDNWLSNRVFRDHDDIVGLCCFYWNRLIEMP